MIRIKYTHFFNGLLNILTYILSLGLGVIGAIALYDTSVILAILVFIVICFGVIFVSMKFLDPIATMLYLGISCGTSVSFEEAKRVSYLFDGSMKNGHWYPMKELHDLPVEQRKKALLAFAEKTPIFG
jgi:hypothetical protein